MKAIAAALALLTSGAASAADNARADAAIASAHFQGVALIGEGDRLVYQRAAGDVRPGLPHQVDSVWPIAAVTKQLTALIALQEVAAGTIDLESPVSTWWPEWRAPNAGKISVRMLLRHESGLPDPALHTGAEHTGADPHTAATTACAALPRSTVPADFHYNDCDYLAIGALLEKVTAKSFATLLDERIAQPLGLSSLGLFRFDAAPPQHVPGLDQSGQPSLASYGAAGSAYMKPHDLWLIDRALMENRLLDRIQTAAMWAGEPHLGFAALGAWSFSAGIKGCPDPVALIERRGSIGGIQIRNFIAPDARIAVILFTNHGDFDYGEISQQSGFAHDMLAAALCPEP